MSFVVDLETLDLCSTETVSVQYEDREWDIALQSETNMFCEASSIAVDVQAALNLAKPPVGLRLRVAEGADAIVCPMSVLLACPSYIAKTFQGMSWVPLMEGEDNTGVINDDVNVLPPPPPPADSPIPPPTADSHMPPPPADSPMPPPLRSPIEPDIPFLELCGSTASPSEGRGRPLTAPPSDRGRFMLRPRPGKREGHGRPLSATPSDKSFGMRRIRPAKREGFGRPLTALPSDHSGCGIGCSSSPHGFRCEETADEAWPLTEPSFDMGSNRCSWSSFDGQRLSELCEGDAGWVSFARGDELAVGGDIWASDTRKPPRECWV
ncbi:unnamed protein product [Ascophyllum nodosum]